MLGGFAPCYGCIDNAIHSYAGVQLREECYKIMQEQGGLEETGTAKITKGYNLPCKYIMHTVGPIVRTTLNEKLCNDLKSCYEYCLKLADENNLESIAFCVSQLVSFIFLMRKQPKLQ